MTNRPAAAAGTIALGGQLEVTRMGFGAMRITGPGIWGDPPDRETAKAVLRRAVELGVDLIDTADSYGPFVSEELIREALHPYDDVTVATKAGLIRTGPDRWHTLGRPEYLRFACEMSLRRLGVDTIDLFQLHRIDRAVPAEEQFGVLRELQEEGKIRHIGLSEVTVEQLDAARATIEVVSVQNRYNVAERRHDDVVDACEAAGIAFLPWFPVGGRKLTEPDGPLAATADQVGATPAQVALAWLLHRSPVMLPIPGTSSLDHLEENVAAAELELAAPQLETLDELG